MCCELPGERALEKGVSNWVLLKNLAEAAVGSLREGVRGRGRR